MPITLNVRVSVLDFFQSEFRITTRQSIDFACMAIKSSR